MWMERDMVWFYGFPLVKLNFFGGILKNVGVLSEVKCTNWVRFFYFLKLKKVFLEQPVSNPKHFHSFIQIFIFCFFTLICFFFLIIWIIRWFWVVRREPSLICWFEELKVITYFISFLSLLNRLIKLGLILDCSLLWKK